MGSPHMLSKGEVKVGKGGKGQEGCDSKVCGCGNGIVYTCSAKFVVCWVDMMMCVQF